MPLACVRVCVGGLCVGMFNITWHCVDVCNTCVVCMCVCVYLDCTLARALRTLFRRRHGEIEMGGTTGAIRRRIDFGLALARLKTFVCVCV